MRPQYYSYDIIVTMASDQVGEAVNEVTIPPAPANLAKKASVKFVDLVNPKFKAFNRPLLLAMPVGVVTVALFIWSITAIYFKVEYIQQLEMWENFSFVITERLQVCPNYANSGARDHEMC